MRKILEIASLVSIVAAAVLIFTLTQQEISAPVQQSHATVLREPLADFPMNQERRVDFEMAEGSLSRLSVRERRDQALDWFLFTVVRSAGLSIEDLSRALHDLSPVRVGYAKPVANFEYGTTRSRYIGDGRVVAIIPRDVSGGARSDLLAHIVDQHRKDLGSMPDKLLIFEYSLTADLSYGTLQRTGEAAASTLFDEESGYYEAPVQDLKDLTRFMQRTQDITYVRRENGQLVLGGRRQFATPNRSIRVEDVAALWQANRKLQEDLRPYDEWERDVDAFNSRWAGRTYVTSTENARYEVEIQDLKRRKEQFKNQKRVTGTGFSLDPIYDFKALQDRFAELQPTLLKLTGVNHEVLPPAMIDDAIKGMQVGNATALLLLVEHLQGSDQGANQLWGAFVKEILDSSRLQAARYDGELQGTEVGMVLFYTDLLAKLWALDYVESAPNRFIEDFYPLTQVTPSPVFYQETQEYSNCRVWFGTRDDGFQVAADGHELLFARTASRVYAASSNDLHPGVEVGPSAPFEAFLGWWNDHYEEIARFEPEYQRLNEIMKWSMVISWLTKNGADSALNFLGDVNVDRSSWFPEWVKHQPQLRFQNWSHLQFYPSGHLGHSTESMPLLRSKSFVLFPKSKFEWQTSLSGGVSLGNRQLFEQQRSIKRATSQLLRRSSIDYADTGFAPKAFRTLDGTRYEFVHPRSMQALVKVTPRDKVRLRDGYGQTARRVVERSIHQADDGALRIDTASVEGARRIDLGSLEIRGTGSGFRVAWRSREIDVAQQLARAASRADDPVQAMLSDPFVETVVAFPNGGVAVRLKGPQEWLTLVPEERPGVELAAGWDARVADPGALRTVQMAWEKSAALANRLKSSTYVAIEPVQGESRLVFRYRARGPPPTGRNVEMQTQHGSVQASYDVENGSIFVPLNDLPAPLRDPDVLRTAFTTQDVRQIAQLAKAESGEIRYTVGGGGKGDGPRGPSDTWFDNFDRGDHRRVAQILAVDPQATRKLLGHLGDDLRRTDRLMERGETVRALHELQHLETLYGPVPDILARRAIAQLNRSHVEDATQALAESLRRQPRDRKALLDEIQSRIDHAHSDSNRQDLEQLRKLLNWHNKGAFNSFGGKLLPVVDHGRLKAGFKLADGDNLTSITPDEIARIPRDAVIYVQDSPTLNNIDWTPSLQQVLRDLPTGSLGSVAKLPHGPIGKYQPSVIYDPNGVQFHSVKGNPGHSSFRPELKGRDDCDPDDTCPQSKEKEVYLVRAGSASV